MRRGRWLGHQIEDIIIPETGASFEELAERAGVPFPEVRATVWRLYGAGRVDICHGYVVAIPSAAEGSSAA